MIQTFWKNIPGAMTNIFDVPQVANLLCLCDVSLYRTMLAVLAPRPAECMPDGYDGIGSCTDLTTGIFVRTKTEGSDFLCRLKNELKQMLQTLLRTTSGLGAHFSKQLQRRRSTGLFTASLSELSFHNSCSVAIKKGWVILNNG